MADFVKEIPAPIIWFAELLNEEMPDKSAFMESLRMSNRELFNDLSSLHYDIRDAAMDPENFDEDYMINYCAQTAFVCLLMAFKAKRKQDKAEREPDIRDGSEHGEYD